MFTEILSVTAIVWSSVATWRCIVAQHRANSDAAKSEAHANASHKSSEMSARAALASRSHSVSSLASKRAEAAGNSDGSNQLLALFSKLVDSPSSPTPRNRRQVYEDVARNADAAEDKEAIKAAMAERRKPVWLRWTGAAPTNLGAEGMNNP
jgi:hypothetical protein